jgi:hypothetical protein
VRAARLARLCLPHARFRFADDYAPQGIRIATASLPRPVIRRKS